MLCSFMSSRYRPLDGKEIHMDQWKEVKRRIGGPAEVIAEHELLIAWQEVGYGLRSKDKPIPFGFSVKLDGIDEPISIEGTVYGVNRLSGGVILLDGYHAPFWVRDVDARRDAEAAAYRSTHRYSEAQAVEHVYNQLIDLIIRKAVK